MLNKNLYFIKNPILLFIFFFLFTSVMCLTSSASSVPNSPTPSGLFDIPLSGSKYINNLSIESSVVALNTPITSNTLSSNSEAFSISYSQNSWKTGASVTITIKNNTTSAVNGWTLNYTFPGNQKITNTWYCNYTQSSKAVTMKNSTYNRIIPAGGSISFGFNISFTGVNKAPNDFSVKPETPKTPKTPETPGKFHVFLLLGQSNMAGYPKSQSSDKVEDPRILVLGYDNNPALGRVKDQWDVACPPLHETYQDAIGPGDWFAKTIVKKVPEEDTIGLVPCAISGEKIETFMKSGGSKYNWIINRVKLAQQKGGIIEGILFHQGESNNGDANWPSKVNILVEDLKKDLNLGDIPFIAGELLYSGGCVGHNTLVNKLPSVVKNCYVVSANGLVVDPADTQWRLHFSHDSQVTLGKRYAQKMIEVLGW